MESGLDDSPDAAPSELVAGGDGGRRVRFMLSIVAVRRFNPGVESRLPMVDETWLMPGSDK